MHRLPTGLSAVNLEAAYGALDFLTRLRDAAHFHPQVSANAVKQMIASQRSVTGERGDGIECIKPRGRPLRHTQQASSQGHLK